MTFGVSLRLVLLAASLPIGGCRAAQPFFCFVQTSVKWERTPHGYDAGTGGVVMLGEDHRFLEVISTLYREQKTHTLSLDSKLGYVVLTGTWAAHSRDAINVTSRVTDSFKFMVKDPGTGKAELWRLEGSQLGPFRRILRNVSTEFEFSAPLGQDKDIRMPWSSYAGDVSGKKE